MDEITLLNQRFNALIDKVRCLTDGSAPSPVCDTHGHFSSGNCGCKTYTVNVPGAVARARQKELINVIDAALNRIASAVSPEVKSTGGCSDGKKIFTVEELLFLEKKLRAFPSVLDKAPSDG